MSFKMSLVICFPFVKYVYINSTEILLKQWACSFVLSPSMHNVPNWPGTLTAKTFTVCLTFWDVPYKKARYSREHLTGLWEMLQMIHCIHFKAFISLISLLNICACALNFLWNSHWLIKHYFIEEVYLFKLMFFKYFWDVPRNTGWLFFQNSS